MCWLFAKALNKEHGAWGIEHRVESQKTEDTYEK